MGRILGHDRCGFGGGLGALRCGLGVRGMAGDEVLMGRILGYDRLGHARCAATNRLVTDLCIFLWLMRCTLPWRAAPHASLSGLHPTANAA
jgi:hypothetical protein